MKLWVNDDAPIELDARLRGIGRELGAQPQVVQDAAAVAREVVRQVHDRGLARGDVETRVRFDGLDLEIDLTYTGRPLRLEAAAQPHREELVEENFFTVGLVSYLQGVYPANTSTHVRDDQVTLTLSFVNR